MTMTMTIEELNKILLDYMKEAHLKDNSIPTKYGFAKKCGFVSYKALQRFLATLGDEGRDFVESLGDELKIYYTEYLGKAKNQSEVAVRTKLLSLCGELQEKQTLDIGLNPITDGTANIDFALMARVKNVASINFDNAKEEN